MRETSVWFFCPSVLLSYDVVDNSTHDDNYGPRAAVGVCQTVAGQYLHFQAVGSNLCLTEGTQLHPHRDVFCVFVYFVNLYHSTRLVCLQTCLPRRRGRDVADPIPRQEANLFAVPPVTQYHILQHLIFPGVSSGGFHSVLALMALGGLSKSIEVCANVLVVCLQSVVDVTGERSGDWRRQTEGRGQRAAVFLCLRGSRAPQERRDGCR